MPAKSGKRGRKGKSSKRAASSSQHAETIPKPEPHSKIDYSKWEKDFPDSDEDSDQDGAYFPFPGDFDSPAEGCPCPKCRARSAAERAGQFAHKKTSQGSSHSSSAQAPPTKPGSFDFSKALGNSAKGKGAGSKSSQKHDGSNASFHIDDDSSWMKAIDREIASDGSSHELGMTAVPSGNATKASQIEYTDKAACKDMIQKYLMASNFPPTVVCNVLERFESASQSGESPFETVSRVFTDLRIPLDPLDMSIVEGSLPLDLDSKKKFLGDLRNRQSKTGSKTETTEPSQIPGSQSLVEALAKNGKTPGLPQFNAFAAAAEEVAQNGSYHQSSKTGSKMQKEAVHDGSDSDELPDLMASDDDGDIDLASDDDGDIDLASDDDGDIDLASDDDGDIDQDSDTSTDDSEDMPGLVDLPVQPSFPSRPADDHHELFDALSAAYEQSLKPPAAKASGAKAPTANPSAARPSSAKSPAAAKPPAAKLPSLARSNAKGKVTEHPAAKAARAAAAGQPHKVDTVSDDDDDDDDDMPGLVDSDPEAEEEEDSMWPPSAAAPKAGKQSIPRSDRMTDRLKFSFDEKGSVKAEVLKQGQDKAAPAASRSQDKQKPAASASKAKAEPSANPSEGKQVPSEAASKGKPAPSPASGEPLFRPVSRGSLAQYASLMRESEDLKTDAQATSSKASTEQKQSGSGFDFSFDRPSGTKPGAKEAPAASSSRFADDALDGNYLSESAAKIFWQAQGNKPAWQAAEEVRRAQMEGQEPFMARYGQPEETPQQRQAKQQAADAAMQKLLEEEEQEKAEAAAKAEKAKREKQKNKKAKQKAKKKAQQERDAKRSASKAARSPPHSKKPPQEPDSASSDMDEEEEEPFSLHDSRFGSLLSESTPTTAPLGSGGVDQGLKQGSATSTQPAVGGLAAGRPHAASASVNSNANESTANSEHEADEDSMLRQLGPGAAMMQMFPKAGPSSEKSYSSQDTQSSAQQGGAIPVLKPGQSPLQWSQARPQAKQAGSNTPALANRLHQQRQQQQQVTGVSRGVSQGSSLPSPAGVALPQPGMGPSSQIMQHEASDPQLAEAMKQFRLLIIEIDRAMDEGLRDRLQQGIRAGVRWLSLNGPNPDFAVNSAQVREKLREARAKAKDLVNGAAGPEAAAAATSAAAEVIHTVATSPVSQALPSTQPPAQPRAQHSAQPRTQATPPLLPADLVPSGPPANPHHNSQTPGLTSGRSSPVSQVGPASSTTQGQLINRVNEAQRSHGSQFAFAPGMRNAAGHLEEPGKGPQPSGPALEPFRYPPRGVGGRGVAARGRGVGPDGRGPHQYQGRGFPGGQPPPPKEPYSAYRQRQAQARPPSQAPLARAIPPRGSTTSQAGSASSEHSHLERNALSGSEATSPVKRPVVRQQRYVQPTPFGVPEQPSFQDDYDDNDCVVCMDAVKCTIFVPCGHCLCCQSCAAKVTNTRGRCPLCDIPTDGFCDSH